MRNPAFYIKIIPHPTPLLLFRRGNSRSALPCRQQRLNGRLKSTLRLTLKITCFVIPNVREESSFFILKSYLTLPLSYFLGEGIVGRRRHADLLSIHILILPNKGGACHFAPKNLIIEQIYIFITGLFLILQGALIVHQKGFFQVRLQDYYFCRHHSISIL